MFNAVDMLSARGPLTLTCPSGLLAPAQLPRSGRAQLCAPHNGACVVVIRTVQGNFPVNGMVRRRGLGCVRLLPHVSDARFSQRRRSSAPRAVGEALFVLRLSKCLFEDAYTWDR